MRKRFDDYFDDNFITVRRAEGKPYVNIIAESHDDMTHIALCKDTLIQLIEHLQEVYKEM